MAANGRGHMRPNSAGRSPPFVVIGLSVVIGILGFNYWSSTSKNSALSTDVEELGLKYRSTQSKKLEIERSNGQLQQKIDESNQRSQKLEQELKDKNYNLDEAIKKSDDLQARIDNIAQELEATKNDLNICDDDVGFCHENITRITIAQKKQIEELQNLCSNKVDEARAQAEQRASDVENSCQEAVQSMRLSVLRSVQHVFGTKAVLLLNQQAFVDVSGIDLSAPDRPNLQPLPTEQQQQQPGVQLPNLNQPETQSQQQQQQQQQDSQQQQQDSQQQIQQQPDQQQQISNSQISDQHKLSSEQLQLQQAQVAAPQEGNIPQLQQPGDEVQDSVDQQDDLNPQQQQAEQQMNEGNFGQEDQRSQEVANEDTSAKAQEQVIDEVHQEEANSARNSLRTLPGLAGNVLVHAAQHGYSPQQQHFPNPPRIQQAPFGRIVDGHQEQQQPQAPYGRIVDNHQEPQQQQPQLLNPRYGNHVINQGSDHINPPYDQLREVGRPGANENIPQTPGSDFVPDQAPAGQMIAIHHDNFRDQEKDAPLDDNPDQNELIDQDRIHLHNMNDIDQQADQDDYLNDRDLDQSNNDNDGYVIDQNDVQDRDGNQYDDQQAPVGDLHRSELNLPQGDIGYDNNKEYQQIDDLSRDENMVDGMRQQQQYGPA